MPASGPSPVEPGRTPYLSIVATSRNDNHGGDLLSRMQFFVDGLAWFADQHNLPCELVLVEWNPPSERPPLIEALRWPGQSTRLAIRVVTVPPERHQRLAYADALPLFQMIAKNVGIRRANGAFVLATNVDVLMGKPLMQTLATRPLRPGRLYRLDRHDVPAEPPDDVDMSGLLDWCAANVIRVARREGVFVPGESRRGASARAVARLAVHGVRKLGREVGAAAPNPLRMASAAAIVAGKAFRGLRAQRTGPRLHTHACGDFTLMAREDWRRLRGYPEFEMFSWHIDSLLMYHAHKVGIVETAWPDPICIYHIDHGDGWSPESNAALFDRLAARGIACLDDNSLRRYHDALQGGPADFTFNGENWGLADEDLAEAAPAPAPPIARVANA